MVEVGDVEEADMILVDLSEGPGAAQRD